MSGRRWTRCSCGHRAQDHNRLLEADKWGCDCGHTDKCRREGCHPTPCPCEDYDGHEEQQLADGSWVRV